MATGVIDGHRIFRALFTDLTVRAASTEIPLKT